MSVRSPIGPEVIRTFLSSLILAILSSVAFVGWNLRNQTAENGSNIAALTEKIDGLAPLLEAKTADRWTKTDEDASQKAQNLVTTSIQQSLDRNDTAITKNADAIAQIWRELARLEAKTETAP